MRLGDDRHLDYSDPDAMIGMRVGPFTIVRLLGEGNMGNVYVAEHGVLKLLRAVKLLSPQLSQDALLVRRFVNEARAVARLAHRNLIQVHDIGELPSGAWFMVLDYLGGDTLGCYMANHAGPMPVHAIVHVVCEIANGLQVAHEHKVVHRDLRPENVFLVVRDSDPYHAVVLDFGVAQLGDDLAAGPGARTGTVLGTPAYMSPEQLRGAKVSPAADIFALGVIAYQMSTGGWFPHQYDESKASYCELGANDLYHRQTTRLPVDPRERSAGLGSAWATAILAALSPDPAQRPPTARAFALRLAEALPPVGLERNGLALVRAHARELVESRGREAVRALQASADAGSRYQLGDKLGTGGMAEVFTGTMIGVEGFARRVAIKRVLAGLSQVPAFATMLVAEAQIVSQLAHPNIVSVLDFSRDLENRLFLVMEYVDGKDLASLLKSGPITPSLAIFIVVEMLRGLGYAHDLPNPASGTRGVVHRDVSPQNLLLSYEGAVKVSDFGLAKARDASEGVWSETVRGKPSYMSPEQVSGEMLDGRTDLYAVGVMLWEMLAHRPLFAGTSKEIMAQVMFKGIAAPSGFCSSVPPDLEGIAMKLLERDRDARYPTAEAAIEALLHCHDVPRDGRGELVQLLAERFPRVTGARSQRMSGSVTAGAPRAPGAEPLTVSAPPSVVVSASQSMLSLSALVRPRRGLLAVTVFVVIFVSLAAAVVVARGEVVRAGPMDRWALPSPARAPATRATATVDTAGIVKPRAVIWRNGKRSGQTPFRAAVPAGRYRLRLANDDVGQDETKTVTVGPDETATIERSW